MTFSYAEMAQGPHENRPRFPRPKYAAPPLPPMNLASDDPVRTPEWQCMVLRKPKRSIIFAEVQQVVAEVPKVVEEDNKSRRNRKGKGKSKVAVPEVKVVVPVVVQVVVPVVQVVVPVVPSEPVWNLSSGIALIEMSMAQRPKSHRVCPSFREGRECSDLACLWAHSLEEYVPPPCRYGNECRGKSTKCDHMHPSETLEEYYKRTGRRAPNFQRRSSAVSCKNLERPKTHRICTAIREGRECSTLGCMDAHTLEEYMPPSCRHGDECRSRLTQCTHMHPSETLDEYYKRTGRKAPKFRKRSTRHQDSNGWITDRRGCGR